MTDRDILQDIIDTVRRKIRDGEIPQHIKDYVVATAHSEKSSAALSTWMRGQLDGAELVSFDGLIDSAMGDELLSRRLDDWEERWKWAVVQKMVEEEFDRRVQSGEMVREINDNGEEVFSNNRPELKPDDNGAA
jgi:hypothetical protein